MMFNDALFELCYYHGKTHEAEVVIDYPVG